MAHFAKLGLNSKVTGIHVVDNAILVDENGNEQEQLGIDFLSKIHKYPFWVQTSYNNNFRKNYAVIGSKYDDELDMFTIPQPFDSWTFNNNTLDWEAPVPYPEDGKDYEWSELTQQWVELVLFEE